MSRNSVTARQRSVNTDIVLMLHLIDSTFWNSSLCLLLWRNCLFGPEWASWSRFELTISVCQRRALCRFKSRTVGEPHLVLTSSPRHSGMECLSMEWPTRLRHLLEQWFMSRWPDLTHILTAQSAKGKLFFLHSGVCEFPKLQQHLYYFQFILLVPSLALVHSKQKGEEVREEINSTVSADKKKRVKLNWIKLNWSVTRELTQYIRCSQITGWCLSLEAILIPESMGGSIFPSVWVNINKVWSLSDLLTPPRRI